MARQMTIPLLAILGISISCLTAEAQDTDQERIQGTWEIVSFIQSGEAEGNEVGKHLLFEGSRIFSEDEEPEGFKLLFELDESAMPTHFDMSIMSVLGEDPFEIRMLGIYELDGDTLTLCLNASDSENRPTKFESHADSEVGLIHLKRVVEEE